MKSINRSAVKRPVNTRKRNVPRLVIEEGAVAEFYEGPLRQTEIRKFPGLGLDANGNPTTPEGVIAGVDGVQQDPPKQ